jgi:hypothetical protein
MTGLGVRPGIGRGRMTRNEAGAAPAQYAASLRMPSAIFSGLTMNQSSRTWL